MKLIRLYTSDKNFQGQIYWQLWEIFRENWYILKKEDSENNRNKNNDKKNKIYEIQSMFFFPDFVRNTIIIFQILYVFFGILSLDFFEGFRHSKESFPKNRKQKQAHIYCNNKENEDFHRHIHGAKFPKSYKNQNPQKSEKLWSLLDFWLQFFSQFFVIFFEFCLVFFEFFLWVFYHIFMKNNIYFIVSYFGKKYKKSHPFLSEIFGYIPYLWSFAHFVISLSLNLLKT